VAPGGIRELALVAKAAQPPTSGSRASFARDALRGQRLLAKKNPNLKKINNLRSSDRHIAA
jgi:hypothetical protein